MHSETLEVPPAVEDPAIATTGSSSASSASSSGTLAAQTPRRIILFCDGSGRDGSTLPTNRDTNIYRLYRVIGSAPSKPGDMEQVLLWQPGVGMEKGEPFMEGLLGRQLNKKIQRAYQMILDVYTGPSDEIVLIGFSRGALICRAIASIIGDIGLSHTTELDSIFEAYASLPHWEVDTMKPAPPGPKAVKALAVIEKHRVPASQTIRIKALAIFDTVGALGIPSRTHLPNYQFFGYPIERVGPHVDHIFHALSLDDTATAFFPTRVELTKEGLAMGQEGQLHQCWFTGWHADVGGGWDHHELACVALMWMAAHLSESSIVRLDTETLFEIPGTYSDSSKPQGGALPTHRPFKRVQPPTDPWGAGLTRVDIRPFYGWFTGAPRPPLKGDDTVHASSFNPIQVERRRKRNPKLQALLDEMSCPPLLPLERLAQRCWPVAASAAL